MEVKFFSFLYLDINISKNLFFIFLFFAHFLMVNMSSNFKNIILDNGDILIINKNGIYAYNKNTFLISKSYNFESSLQINTKDIEQISHFKFSPNSGDKYYFILVNNILFIFSSDGEFKYKYTISSETNTNYITPFKFINSNQCKYFVEYVNSNNNLVIKLFEYDFYSNSNNLLSTNELNILNSSGNKMKNIVNNLCCELMINSNNDNLLTFFFENENPKEIIASSFNVDETTNIINIYNTNTYSNNGIKIIKSYISSDKKKSLICFIDNSNYGNCIIYNLNEFSEYTFNPSLNNCLTNSLSYLSIEKPIDSNNYFIYCFYSSSEFSLIELDDNFEIIQNSKDYKINLSSINNCNEYYFIPLIINSNDINILLNCNKDSFFLSKYEAEEEYIDITNSATNIPLKSIQNKIDKFLDIISIGNKYNILGEEFNIKITSIDDKQDSNTDFLTCEEKIRNYYHLNSDSPIILFQVEIFINDKSTLTNQIRYGLIDENKKKLDLSICENEYIKINYKIKNNSPLNISKVLEFSNKGIDILNINDSFFNDICFVYSEDDSDMILSDRIKYVYQNYSMCDDGCIYEKINIEKMLISCKCPIYNHIYTKIENTNLFSKCLNLLQYSTIGVIKCYKLVFTTPKIKNIGFWIFIIATISRIVLYIIYFKSGISPIQKYINEQMIKYHYIINDNKNNEDNEEKKKPIKLNTRKKNFKRKKEIYSSEKKIININTKKEKKKKIKVIKIIKKNKITMPKSKDELILNKKNKNQKNYKETNDTIVQSEENILRPLRKVKTKIKEIEGILKENLDGEVYEYYNLIKIDANNSSKNKIPLESKFILDNYDYDLALQYEKRSFGKILYIIFLSKDDLINTFLFKSPLHLKCLRICILFLSIIIDCILNCLFYFSDNISSQFHYKGNHEYIYQFAENFFSYFISTIICMFCSYLLENLTESKNKLEADFRNEEDKMRNDEKYIVSDERKIEIQKKIDKTLKILKIKIIIFIIIDLIVILFSFYYIIAFCEVYYHTQIHLLIDSIFSFIIQFPIELLGSLLLTILYKISLKYKWKILYKIVLFFV